MLRQARGATPSGDQRPYPVNSLPSPANSHPSPVNSLSRLYVVTAATLGWNLGERPPLVINDPSQLAGIHSQGATSTDERKEGGEGGEAGGSQPEVGKGAEGVVHFEEDPKFKSVYTGAELVRRMSK
eukprot:628985-Prorocentrum_minimum.AAC.1